MDDRVWKKPRSDHTELEDAPQGSGESSPTRSYERRSSGSHSRHSHRSRADDDRGHHRHRDHDRHRRHREHRERRERREEAYRSHHESRSRSTRDSEREHSRRHRHRTEPSDDAYEPRSSVTAPEPSASGLKRDDWMLPSASENSGGADFFGSIGQTRTKEPKSEQPNPDELQVYSRELNPMLNPKSTASTEPKDRKEDYGAPGHKWRTMKLRRTYEIAEQSGVPVEQVALDRYGSMEAFDEARSERQYLEDRRALSGDHSRPGAGTPRSGTSAFRRPGASPLPRPAPHEPETPAPVRIPTVLPRAPTASDEPDRVLSLTELNRLEAKALRAEMTNQADAPALRAELEKAKQVFSASGPTETVEALPVIDGYGRMYDVGTSDASQIEAQAAMSKKRRKNEPDEPADESLAELVRQERLDAGRMDQKNGDAALAQQIATDHGFENDLDYMDGEAQRLARKKMRDDAMKRQFAIQDFARTKRALDECTFCWQDEGRMPPRANIVSSGTCTYLALPDREPLVDGHCWIVPMQHHVSSLDVDEDGWTEIRNFMKCLIRMAATRNQSMVFFETVLSLRQQKHTYIEAVPIPNDVFAELPAYFKTSLSEVESEWADHAKIIYFSEARPFQRSMVSKLPYFMIQWDYKGQRGYGHVIESRDDEHGRKLGGTDYEEPTYADGDHVGGAGFPKYVHTTDPLGILHKRSSAVCSTWSRTSGGAPAMSRACTPCSSASAPRGPPSTGPARLRRPERG